MRETPSTFTTLYNFGPPTDGAQPSSALLDIGGLLYTSYGGTNNGGTFFR